MGIELNEPIGAGSANLVPDALRIEGKAEGCLQVNVKVWANRQENYAEKQFVRVTDGNFDTTFIGDELARVEVLCGKPIHVLVECTELLDPESECDPGIYVGGLRCPVANRDDLSGTLNGEVGHGCGEAAGGVQFPDATGVDPCAKLYPSTPDFNVHLWGMIPVEPSLKLNHPKKNTADTLRLGGTQLTDGTIKLRKGLRLHYRQTWKLKGVHLGDLASVLSLAPGRNLKSL